MARKIPSQKIIGMAGNSGLNHGYFYYRRALAFQMAKETKNFMRPPQRSALSFTFATGRVAKN
jgi:hypothetical protein